MRGDIHSVFFLLYPIDFIRYLRLLAMFLTLPMDKKIKTKSVFLAKTKGGAKSSFIEFN